MNIGDKLSENKWFAHNTLKFVFFYLDSKELLNASKVCQMWECIISEYFLQHFFVPTCVKHIEKLIQNHGNQIYRFQLVDTHQIILEVSLFKAVSCSRNFNVTNCHPKLITHLAGQEYDFPLKNTFVKEITNLSALRLYTDRMIFIENPNKKEFLSDTFYWRSLLRIKYLTNLELGFHIPSDFGMKVLKHLKHLEILKLHMYSGVDDNIFKSIKNLGNLKELTILKVYVNKDFTTFLPTLEKLQKMTIMIRAPCDTNYYYLLQSILQLHSLKHFVWVVNDATTSNVFFGHNCQTLLKMKNTFTDQKCIESALKGLFSNIKTSFLLADTQYFPKLQRKFKTCFQCVEENIKVPCSLTIDATDDCLCQTTTSMYDIDEIHLLEDIREKLSKHEDDGP